MLLLRPNYLAFLSHRRRFGPLQHWISPGNGSGTVASRDGGNACCATSCPPPCVVPPPSCACHAQPQLRCSAQQAHPRAQLLCSAAASLLGTAGGTSRHPLVPSLTGSGIGSTEVPRVARQHISREKYRGSRWRGLEEEHHKGLGAAEMEPGTGACMFCRRARKGGSAWHPGPPAHLSSLPSSTAILSQHRAQSLPLKVSRTAISPVHSGGLCPSLQATPRQRSALRLSPSLGLASVDNLHPRPGQCLPKQQP